MGVAKVDVVHGQCGVAGRTETIAGAIINWQKTSLATRTLL